jgi:hypothetical protein
MKKVVNYDFITGWLVSCGHGATLFVYRVKNKVFLLPDPLFSSYMVQVF